MTFALTFCISVVHSWHLSNVTKSHAEFSARFPMYINSQWWRGYIVHDNTSIVLFRFYLWDGLRFPQRVTWSHRYLYAMLFSLYPQHVCMHVSMLRVYSFRLSVRPFVRSFVCTYVRPSSS